MFSTTTLAATLLLFVLGSTTVLLSLIRRDSRLQRLALGFMVAGFVAQTLWIGGICVRTKHPPLTNLREIAAFLAWTILLVQFGLFFRYRVQAAAFFVYPLALLLMTVSALVHEHYAPLDASLRSNLFVAHLFLSTVGVAALRRAKIPSWPAIAPVVVMLIGVATAFASTRYRASAEPAMVILAAAGAVAVLDRWLPRRARVS